MSWLGDKNKLRFCLRSRCRSGRLVFNLVEVRAPPSAVLVHVYFGSPTRGLLEIAQDHAADRALGLFMHTKSCNRLILEYCSAWNLFPKWQIAGEVGWGRGEGEQVGGWLDEQ